MHFRVLILAVAFVFAQASPAGGVAAAPAQDLPISVERAIPVADYCADAEELAFLTLINDYRAQNGLGPLTLTQTLGAAAYHHSLDMANRNYVSHTLADGTSWSQNIRNHGYSASTSIGENIAAGNASASATFNQWRSSPGHNANMLSANHAAIGVGRAYGANSAYGWYWTATFGGVVDGAAARCGQSTPPPADPPAPAGTPARTTANLNLRSNPSLSAAILTVMPAGSSVTVTGPAQGGFYPVSYGAQQGWASGDFLSFDGNTPSNPAPSGDTAQTTTALNLRAGPSLADAVIMVMPAGAVVTLTGNAANGFLSVSYNGTQGWAHADYLTSGGAPAAPQEPPPGSGTGTATTTVALNLRAGPSTSDAVLAVIPTGAAVALTGQSANGFLSVSYGGRNGWAYAAYLSTAGQIDAPGSVTATVTTSLNLRTGPSLADHVILVMPPGATVTLTGNRANGFEAVSYNGISGWAYGAYLR